MPEKCKCTCGYTCGRKCGLPLLKCMEEHYVHDCGHVWDGHTVYFPNGESVTCSKCGEVDMYHDMAVGP